EHLGGNANRFLVPFYDRETWQLGSVLNANTVAVLAYTGFDGIATLSEEVENPRRNILLATVLTCLAIGILAALEVYVAQLLWPTSQPFTPPATGFARAAGMVANSGSGAGAQLGAARLLYGMGRSGALPPGFFGFVDPKRSVPRN